MAEQTGFQGLLEGPRQDHLSGMTERLIEAEILRRAASILVKRSTKPRAVGLRIMCKVLRDVADQLEAKAVR